MPDFSVPDYVPDDLLDREPFRCCPAELAISFTITHIKHFREWLRLNPDLGMPHDMPLDELMKAVSKAWADHQPS